jgi:DNA-binding transcriptional MocR family regulator
MDPNWNDNQPIYRQLRDRMVALILEGALKEGDPLPSVRAVAADYRLNPLTVLKGYGHKFWRSFIGSDFPHRNCSRKHRRLPTRLRRPAGPSPRKNENHHACAHRSP